MAMRPVRVALLLVALLLAVVGHMPAVSATRMLLADDEHAGHSPDEHAAATAGTAHTTSSSKTAVGIAVSAVHGTKPLVDTSTAAVKPVPLLIPHPVAKNVPGSDGSHHEPEFEAVFDPEHEYEYGNDEDDEFFPEDEYAEHEKVLPGVLPGFEALSSPVKVVRTAPHEPVFSTPREYEKVYEAQYDGYGEDDDEFLAYEHDVAEVGDYFPENVAIDTVSVTASASATSGATAAGSTASRPIPEAPKPSVVAPEHDVHDIHYTYVLPDHVDHLEHVGHVDTSVVAVPRTVVSPVKAAVQKTTDASKPTALASDMHDEMHEHARASPMEHDDHDGEHDDHGADSSKAPAPTTATTATVDGEAAAGNTITTADGDAAETDTPVVATPVSGAFSAAGASALVATCAAALIAAVLL